MSPTLFLINIKKIIFPCAFDSGFQKKNKS